MSTIVSTIIQDRASGKNLPTASMISGAAKAWVLISGTAVPAGIHTAFNVASIGDLGVGMYQVNLTSPLVAFTVHVAGSYANIAYPVTHAATSYQIYLITHAGVAQDQNADSICVGNLA